MFWKIIWFLIDIIEPLAHLILKIFNFLILKPIDKIITFLIVTKRKIREGLRNRVICEIIACLIFALLVGSSTYSHSSFYNENQDNVLYFLSSASQGLAGFVALAFTISIFGAQMIGGSEAIDKVMDRWTKLYALLCAIGIILPLIQLKTGIYSIDLAPTRDITWNIDFLAIDLFFLVFCVLGIIPHFNRVKRITKYDGSIVQSNDEARDAIVTGNEGNASKKILKLGKLGRNALEDSLPDEVMSITTMIRNLGWLSVENNLENSTIRAIIELESLGLKAMDKKTNIGPYRVPWVIANHFIFLPDYPMAWNLTNGLREICIGSIDKNFDESTVSFSCEILSYIGYMYIQKIRTTFLKTIDRELRMVLPNQLSLIEGDFSNSKSPTLVQMLLEIAEKSTENRDPLFCWDDITGFDYKKQDLDKINKFFKERTRITYTAYNMEMADNGKTLILYSGPGINYNFELNEEKKQALLIRRSYSMNVFGKEHKSEPECVKILPIYYKDRKKYTYNFKYGETLEHSLIYLWIIGTYIMKNYPVWVTEDIVFQIKRSENSDIRSIFESEYIQQETSHFTYNNDRQDDFKDIVDYIKKFQDFYFGFEEYLQQKRD
jgi:hypothetical protein